MTGSPPSPVVPEPSLLQPLHFERGDALAVGFVGDLDGVAADLAVLDVRLGVDAGVEQHADRREAVRAGKVDFDLGHGGLGWAAVSANAPMLRLAPALVVLVLLASGCTATCPAAVAGPPWPVPRADAALQDRLDALEQLVYETAESWLRDPS